MDTERTPRRSGPLPDPDTEPTISVDRAARILGLSTRAAYKACDRDEIPHVRVGRTVRVLTAQFLRKFHFADDLRPMITKHRTLVS
jgi:excisionase family DNA binding protein